MNWIKWQIWNIHFTVLRLRRKFPAEFFDLETFKDTYFADGYSPRAAMDEELSYWADDADMEGDAK